MIAEQKINCWEFNKCGSEKNRSCQSVIQAAGRNCWLVAGTLNGGVATCLLTPKVVSCKSCNFYSMVKARQI